MQILAICPSLCKQILDKRTIFLTGKSKSIEGTFWSCKSRCPCTIKVAFRILTAGLELAVNGILCESTEVGCHRHLCARTGTSCLWSFMRGNWHKLSTKYHAQECKGKSSKWTCKRFPSQASTEGYFQLICDNIVIGIRFLFIYLLSGDFLGENFWWGQNLDCSFIL